MSLRTSAFLLSLSSIFIAHNASGSLDTIVIEGRQVDLIGGSITASEGVVGQHDIEFRPLLRTGEILEFVPGMVVTQHSGTGKANQYFLRGFNLDHGTDFATSIDGMPVNMRTHGHGQGYTDLNFIIPEAIQSLSYKKGSYYADVGDFSSAGSADFSTVNSVDHGLVELTAGEHNYVRAVALDSQAIGDAHLFYALEANYNDGPWKDIDEDLEKHNALIKYSHPVADGTMAWTLMAYNNQWNSADQIPQRAVQQGIIDELGSIDDTVGGESSRYSASMNWQSSRWSASAYLIHYNMDLWSNFTYFLDDETNGDQFEQVDDRLIYGGDINYHFDSEWLGTPFKNTVGAELRIDDIDEVGLYRTQAKRRLGVIRSDRVDERSVGLYWQSKAEWTPKFRTVLGARYDYYDFENTDKAATNINGVNLSQNSGSADDDKISLKASAIYTVNPNWETYASIGQGFHSNDARGTTINVDPADGSPVDKVDPLVASLGYEGGLRGFITEKLNASIALWALEIDSELLFVGDAGATEANRSSVRRGIEFTNYYFIDDNWSLDFEYAYTDAKFKKNLGEGDEIPGAIEHVLQAGVNAEFDNGWFGSLRLRHFGERPLTEDGSVKSGSSTIMNARLGYQQAHWSVKADVLNLTNSNDHDVTYYYESRLASEPAGVATEDIHYHVFKPRTVRLSLAYEF